MGMSPISMEMVLLDIPNSWDAQNTSPEPGKAALKCFWKSPSTKCQHGDGWCVWGDRTGAADDFGMVTPVSLTSKGHWKMGLVTLDSPVARWVWKLQVVGAAHTQGLHPRALPAINWALPRAIPKITPLFQARWSSWREKCLEVSILSSHRLFTILAPL